MYVLCILGLLFLEISSITLSESPLSPHFIRLKKGIDEKHITFNRIKDKLTNHHGNILALIHFVP